MSKNPKYVTAKRKEYIIFQVGKFFDIKGYRGGKRDQLLHGPFTSFRAAETALITYLKRTDKFKTALYPGCHQLARDKFNAHMKKVEDAKSQN